MDIENQAKQDNKDSQIVEENEQIKTLPPMEEEKEEKQQQQPVQQKPEVQENSERQKKILMETFQQLYERLSKGCGREKCKYDTCLAHPSNRHLVNDQNQAKLKAVEFLKKKLAKIEICNIPQRIIKSLQKSEIDAILQPQYLEQNFKEIIQRLEDVFSDFEALNNSFFLDQNPCQVIEQHNGLIDFKSVIELYNVLLNLNNAEMKKCVEDMFSKSFIKLLGEITKYADYKKQFSTIDDFRVLVFLIIYPNLFEEHCLFIKIMHSFFYLTQRDYEMFGYWLKDLDSSILERINTSIKTKVMISLYQGETEVEAAMNALKIIYTTNVILKRMERDHFIIDIFQNEHEEGINPKSEYILWLKGKENQDKDQRFFTFCNYPFSMDIKFKYQLLEINSKFDQRNEHEKKIRSQIQQGQFIINSSQLFLIFEVSRDNILDDTIQCISQPDLNFKLPFKVKFRGEQGIDEGGVRKEYYQIMIKQLFNPDFGLFLEKQNKQFFWFNSNSIDMPMLYDLIGSLMGIAIYNQIQMDVRLPNVVYKKLIGDPVSLEDIKQFDAATYNGFKHILEYEGDLENDLQLTFSIEYEYFDQTKVYELKPGGDCIPVTQENKKEFIELYVDWYLNKSIERQFNNFKRGFFKVLNLEIIQFFTFDELVLILTGKEELDFNELKENTYYDQGYSEESDQIKWLWEILDEFTMEQKKKFLFFCTGSDRAPVTGFSSLKFIISRHGEENEQLPSAHTCFNHLLIPAYKSKEILKQKLLLSLENAEGFGLY
ncbi:HECT domain ubiquitin transferase (macronuclear) [Tetrahymena thermophila SB210]|uniref:HECT-type E3 ubiquitin transferase n=1 Tax=Tetrahymena thermophila (strain SB210) TaxID=312017 RepID=I7MMC5_TETTS|nr:HECT domain ubiquitin transferase [Tetrahymena thermophila SB210]EAS04589.2 HECT domain ubiquitin transferase [Tetrahymena thermophila SB210]|eukprot:XP_001024834.2 HECT domain ubiquitin transferase [Tetrahymena thermophila SB210]